MKIQLILDLPRLRLGSRTSQIGEGLATTWLLRHLDGVLLMLWQSCENGSSRLIPVVDTDDVIVVSRSSDFVS